MPAEPEAPLTFDAALLELGVDANATSDEIRRAYLRLVKSRSPERDAIGFRRARTAYEVVRSTIAMRKMAANAQASQTAAAPAAAINMSAALHPAEASPPPNANDASSSPQEDARSAASVNPPSLSAEQQATLALVKSAWQIRQTSDWKLMVEAIEAAIRWLNGPPVPVPASVFMIVSLIADEQIEAALQVHRALAAWLDARQDGARIMDANLTVRWLLTQELCAVAAELPSATVTAMAKALLAGDLTQSRDAVADAMLARSQVEIEAALRGHAPHLLDALPPRQMPTNQGRQGSSSRVPLGLLAMVAFFGLRMLASSSSSHDLDLPSVDEPATSQLRPSQLQLTGSADQFKLTPPALIKSSTDDANGLGERAEAVAARADTLQMGDLASAARRLDPVRQTSGCVALLGRVHEMKPAIDRARDRALRTAYRELSAAADHNCKPVATGGSTP